MSVRGMNREAVPLIVGILVPVIFVALIVLYLNGFDITEYLRKINIIYYLLVLPFGLGLLVIILWFRKPRD
jgi:ABC-type multidrug transport system permease subunit